MSAILPWVTVLAAAWLSVSNQFWSQTFLICATGGLYLLFPPPSILPRSILVLLGLLLLLGLTAFVPAGWVETSYRDQFQDHGIDLPGTFSLQPWLSLEDLTLFLTTALWAWHCFETRLSLYQRQILLTAYLLILGLLAFNIIIQGTSWREIVPSFLKGAGQFGNRNQTGDLLLMGGIFSAGCGFSGQPKQKIPGWLWLILSGVFMVAIIRNGSRAAVVLFGLGLLLLLVMKSEFRSRHWLIQATGLILISLVTLIFICVDDQLRDRFFLFWSHGREDRWPIYQDAIHLITANPWCGIGLGNFEGVFNTQRIHSTSLPARCLHPDSDWLWIACELGIGGAICLALLLVLTLKTYLVKTPFPNLTQASLVVVILFWIHSLFDVGGHRPGTIWNCLYLAGLGAFRPATWINSKWNNGALRLMGLFLLAIAALRIQSASENPWMPTRASVAQALAPLPLSRQESLLTRRLHWEPLNWSLYYQRAVVRMQSQGASSGSKADFNRVLFLEQSSTDLPLAIGQACRDSDISESLLAWQELLQRAGNHRADFLDNLYWQPGLDAKTRLQMTILADDDPNMQIIAIVHQQPSDFMWLCENFLASNPSLNGVSPALAARLFDHWVEVGDITEFLNGWPLHPEWRANGWRAYARALARNGFYKNAVTVGLQHLPSPQMPNIDPRQDLPEAIRQSQANPKDFYYLIRLSFAQLSVGANTDAVNTLQKAYALPGHPAFIAYLLAKTLAATGQDQAAWQTLEPLLGKS